MSRRATEAAYVARLRRRRERDAEARLRAAKAGWRALTPKLQARTVSEIVETRARELRRAYPGVLSLTHGFKTRRRNGRRVVVRKACVTFLVREKSDNRDSLGPDAIPKELFAYVTVKRKRTLCAVPTDVECATRSAPRAQRNEQIAVTHAQVGGDPATGVITCIVTYGSVKTRYALSCRHVFGMSASQPASYPVDASVLRAELDAQGQPTRLTSDLLARTADFYGPLVPNEPDSFDAALAEVQAAAPTLQRAVRKFVQASHGNYAQSLSEIEAAKSYKLWTPRGDKLATYVRPWASSDQDELPHGRGIEYDGVGIVMMRTAIVQSQLAEGVLPTIGGDSGSPVVSRDGSKLLGMHIAGSNDGAVYMIPAFELLDGGNYIGLSEALRINLDY